MPGLKLYDIDGRRLYLRGEERRAFFDATMKEPGELRTFCHMLHDTGIRIFEALALRPSKVDLFELYWSC
jgi:integrase/recombinase XerD